jgi:hypothetical protein
MASTLKKNEVSERIWRMFRDYENERTPWAEGAANDEDFFAGKQWTDEEIRKIVAQGMAPLVVNRTMPVILQEIAIFTSKRPTFRYFPRDDGDSKIAAVWSDVAAYIWHNSNADSELQQTMKDYFVTGAGYLQVRVAPDENFGDGEIQIESLPLWDVYPDPNSRKIDLSDSRSIIVSRLVDEGTIAFHYPDKKAAIRAAAAEEGSVMDRPYSNPSNGGAISHSDYQYSPSYDNSKKVRIIECYEKIKVPVYRRINITSGDDGIYRKDEWDLEQLTRGDSEVFSTHITRIKKTVTLGQYVTLSIEEMPTSRYPIVPFFLHHNRNPYPVGDVSVIKGMQQEINKRRSIMIHNATLAGNYRVMAEKGSIANKAEYEEKGSTPGFIMEYHQGFTPPKEMLPQALPTAWIQLEQESKGDVEYAVSVFSHMMGNASDAPDTYRALLSLEESGQRKIRHKAQHANHALRILGLVVFDLASRLYDTPRILRVVGEDNIEVKEIVVNGIEIENGERRKINDLSAGRYDLVVNDGASMPTNRMALLNMYLEMYQLGLVDKTEVLKKTDIVDKEALLERIGEQQQLMGQLDGMEEQMKDLEGLNQTLRRQLQQAMLKQGVEEMASKQKTIVASQQATAEAQKSIMKARMGDAVQMTKERMKLHELTTQQRVSTALAEIKANRKTKTEAKK